LTVEWRCTPGTVQRAYQELAQQGLLVTRPGQGTHVVNSLPSDDHTPLRRAELVHSAEEFLLESLSSGYSAMEVEGALRTALEHWRSMEKKPAPAAPTYTLRFAGSHDLAVGWLSSHFGEIVPHCNLDVVINGSLGGLISLVEGRADLAGSHLWDEESDSYNDAFVRRLLPGKVVAIVTLADRRLGLVLPPGNPLDVHELKDLFHSGVIFANRQAGSGTRVWMDAQLNRRKLKDAELHCYGQEFRTHSEVARSIAEKQANAGLALQASALQYDLEFIPLVNERYDLVIPQEKLDLPAIKKLMTWLQSPKAREIVSSIGGYSSERTGQVRWEGSL
jgi:putative molybdopterin biosynthesis protein